jgi:ABC-type dipeptide/oligopeptide/nickel transport system permease subunit
LSRFVWTVAQYFAALAVVLLFACYGGNPSISGALREAIALVNHTLQGRDIFQNYYEIYPPAIWYSARLVIVATVLGSLGGFLLSIWRVRIRNRVSQGITNVILTVLESVPDDMYVIITTILVLYLYEHFGIELPIFPDTFDPNFIDTIVPAVALALPSGFYMQRVMYLQLRDEQSAQYVTTALSKGVSQRRTFFRHVLPNAYSAFIRNIPVVAGIVISVAIFAEFFFDYEGVLFRLLISSGWTQNAGLKMPGYMLGGFIPEYQAGSIWVIGALVVTLWFAAQAVGSILNRFSVSSGAVNAPASQPTRIQRTPIVIGAAILLAVLVIGTFPHLVTPFSATHIDYGNILAGQVWPLAPSHKHPFGTDDLGRDMLSLMAYGTWPTIILGIAITVIALTGSVVLATITYVTQSRLFTNLISFIGTLLVSMPVLYIAYLLLYPRNATLQALQKETAANIHHQALLFILGIGLLEVGRGGYSFYQAISGWSQFTFMEGVESVGRGRMGTLFNDLRSWFGKFTLEYSFIEFVRVLSIMVQLAALHIFVADKYGIVPFTLAINPPYHGAIPAYNTWFGILGEIVNQYTFISYVWLIYAPVLFLLVTMIGANLVGRGLRGKAPIGVK